MRRFGSTRGRLAPILIRQNNSSGHSSHSLVPSVNDVSNLSDSALHQLGWRMAVLPFHCTGDTAGHALGLGMAEEISGALSGFRGPRLISTATFWDGGKPAADAERRCRTYGLDYVVKGIMEVVGSHVRVTVNLLDVVLDFEPIWSKGFDGHLDNLFLLQRRIVTETVAQLDAEILQTETVEEPEFPTDIAAAHHAVLQAIEAISHPNRPSFMQARGLLERAIELDPDYAAAYAWLAYWCIMAAGQGWVESPRDVTTTAGAAAERAIALDPRDARALTIAGHVKAYLFHDVETALAMHTRAIELNPNLPIAWALSSVAKSYNGEHQVAVRHARIALSLSPQDPLIFFTEHLLVHTLVFSRQLEEAEALSDTVLARNPGHASAIHMRLTTAGHLGRQIDARYWLRALQEIDPDVSIEKLASRIPLKPDDKAYYLEGLRRAGVPERSIQRVSAYG
jgi:TolB-like protein/Tfp pilus assembly protein PilF